MEKNSICDSLKVDITFETLNSPDIFYAIQSVNFVKRLCIQHEFLKPIVILLKKFLNIHRLNVSYLGGMNSFTLTLIVSAFLRMQPSFISFAHCFVGLLEFFGKVFDPGKMAIINDCLVSVEGNQEMIFVSDPFQPEINAARNLIHFDKIKESFKKCYDLLIEKSKNNEEESILISTVYNECI